MLLLASVGFFVAWSFSKVLFLRSWEPCSSASRAAGAGMCCLLS